MLAVVLASPALALAANCARLEVIIRSDSPQSQKAVEYIEQLQTRWPGLAVEVKDALKDKVAFARAHQLIKDYKIEKPGVPLFHAARQLIVGFRDENTTGKQIENLLTMRIYTRDGCPQWRMAVVVVTLGRRKLQERQGRWLKLVSGLVIAALGLVLLFKPDWLI